MLLKEVSRTLEESVRRPCATHLCSHTACLCLARWARTDLVFLLERLLRIHGDGETAVFIRAAHSVVVRTLGDQ